MRLAFLGTPSFAVPALESVVEAGHQVLAVLTQPDRPKGRGQQLAFSPIKEAALRLALPVHQPERVRHPEVVQFLAGLETDVMVVVGYGQIIPQTVIDLPRLGIVNVHASLLPKYRGAAPIQWAIARGERVTGVTTMRIDAGLDTGDILLADETPIGEDETAIELGGRLAVMGARLLVETLDGLGRCAITPRPQDPAAATQAPLLKKEDGLADWNRPAAELHNRARGLLPWPGAYTFFRGQLLHLWRTRPAAELIGGPPGRLQVSKRRLLAACGQSSALELVELQLEGRKRLTSEAFLSGQRLSDNEMLGEEKT